MSEREEPSVHIGIREIYDKLCAVERDVSDLKRAEAARQEAARGREGHRVLLYGTAATALSGLAAGAAALIK